MLMRRGGFIVVLWAFVLFGYSASAENYYVDGSAKSNGNGSLNKPFNNIQRAADTMSPGDTCFIKEGNYFETIRLSNMYGTSDRPIVFANFPGERVVMDGSQRIIGSWKKHEGQIYKIKLDEDIWQLFVNGKSMSSARWPNGNWNDGSIWDKTQSMAWPEKGKGEFGRHYNAELEQLNFDLTGAIIIVNSGSFRTFKSIITKHMPGTDNFVYDKSKVWTHFSSKDKVEKHGYFLEGKLGLLDAPGEWFYEPTTKMLYLWAEGNQNPNTLEVRGKRQSYAFEIQNSSYIQLKGIDFFATTFKLIESRYCMVEDASLLFPSYSRRMLMDLKPMNVTKVVVRKKQSKSKNSIRNCKFEYLDGPALEMNGGGNLIENCYMHDVDYSCTYAGGWTLNMINAPDLVFRRNTVHTTGASEMFKAGNRNLIEFNDLSQSGFLQNDGSLVQISVAQQDQSMTRFNWVHNSVKQGLRFDNMNTPNAPYGKNGTMHHNVSWQTDRIFFKGDNHFIFNNLSFDSHQNDLIISSNKKIQGHNHSTLTRNNLSNTLSGHRTKPGKDYPVPGVADHNWSRDVKGSDIRSQLRDPDNLDFRPKPRAEIIDAGTELKDRPCQFSGQAPDIGAYEFGDENYWIPGYQQEQASVPIPPNESDKVKSNADLMWLKAYQSKRHAVYFGEQEKEVKKAERSSKLFKGNFDNNIYDPGDLQEGKTYYWRVDAMGKSGAVKGETWSFKVEEK